MNTRKYPVGIQTFSEIIRGGYVYVDKTDLMWKLTQTAKYIFLSRPRRFGKSLLSSTLHSYFDADKDLFKGLKVMEMEKEWKRYPVIHLDLSSTKHLSVSEARSELALQLERFENVYGRNPNETSVGMRLGGLILRAYELTKQQAVIIIDEYDAPLLDVLHDEDTLHEMRELLQEFYQRLKMFEPYVKFCFITGITKFSQLSIFSTLNNLTNVTMQPEFSAICGITEDELTTVLQEDICMLAETYGCLPEEMHCKLKQRYDGYHFSEYSSEVYNPFSLLKAFQMRKLSDYWFESGTPTFLIRQMQFFKTDIMSLDTLEVPVTAFDQPTENMHDALPLLYQSGYLTIKGYDREAETYQLSLPNQEVRVGYTKGLIPAYTGLNDSDVQTGFALKFWRALKGVDIDLAMREMQVYLAGVPYVEGFKNKLADAATKEGFYEYTMYLIFSMLNVYVRTQVKCAKGRTDMVVWMSDTVYVFEFKVDGTAEQALKQIDERSYAIPYQTDGRKVVKVGVKFDVNTRVPESWAVANV